VPGCPACPRARVPQLLGLDPLGMPAALIGEPLREGEAGQGIGAGDHDNPEQEISEDEFPADQDPHPIPVSSTRFVVAIRKVIAFAACAPLDSAVP
jgi:hypothetical protein